jgi:hypothetical protein
MPEQIFYSPDQLRSRLVCHSVPVCIGESRTALLSAANYEDNYQGEQDKKLLHIIDF